MQNFIRNRTDSFSAVDNFSVDRCHVHPPISASVKFFAEYKFVTHGSSAGRCHVGQLLGDASASEVEAFLMERKIKLQFKSF